MSDLLKGKRGLIMGVANERSIAWGIAKAMADVELWSPKKDRSICRAQMYVIHDFC